MDWEKYKGKMEPDNRWVEDARRARGDINVARAVEARLENEPDAAVRRRLNFDLTTEYEMAGRYDEAERIYLMLFDQCPDEPMPLISLAGQKLYFENDPAAAMEAIDRAIEVAYRSNNFRRLALGVKARIALAREKFDVVEDVLRRLLQLTHDKRASILRPSGIFSTACRRVRSTKPWRAGSIIIFRARAPLVGRALSGENSDILRDAILKDRSSG
jgi:tetratricopeptide (TPR) repeat protein